MAKAKHTIPASRLLCFSCGISIPRYLSENWVYKGQQIRVHRISYDFFYGLSSPDLDVCHACDVPLCVKPQHLFEGTAQENVNDMFRKGRQAVRPSLPGETNPLAKLTATQVRQIRTLYDAGVSAAALAIQFGITPTHAKRLGKRQGWNHLAV
jgi:Autographiviridae endonuclease